MFADALVPRARRRVGIAGTTAALWVAASLLGCAPTPAGGPIARAAAPSAPPRFVRVVDGFDVRDQDGVRYAHPFTGGLNIPRPQLVDIDADGDADLFVQEATGHVRFFENVGTPRAPQYRWRTDRYADLDVGEWYRFVDMDGDGDFDMLAEQPFSLIRYYRNDGTPQSATYVVAADTLRDVDGEPLFSDRQNIPTVIDLDCDDLSDLFIGRLIGTVSRFEVAGTDDNGVPRFRLVSDRFEDIEIVAQFGSRHGANSLAFSDVDGDGDQDLFWGDFFEPGLLFIENTGTCEAPALRTEPVPFPVGNPLATSGYNAPAFGDPDGDGDLDLFVGVLGGAYNPNQTTRDNFYFFERSSAGSFDIRTRRFLSTIDVGSESMPAFVDLDADGDLDLLLANKIDQDDLKTSRVYRFVNRGTRTQPEFRLDGALDVSGLYHYAPAFGDLDGDGDPDMVLGSWKSEVAYHQNEGTPASPRFVLQEPELIKLTRGSNTTPALVDIDADGDLDLFVGEASGTINFYRNAGSAERPVFVLVTDEFDGIDVGRRSVPAFTDVDGDGDNDMLIGKEEPGFLFYRNDGTPAAARFVRDTSLAVPVPPFSTPLLIDIDADGDLDFFSGGSGGGLVYYENIP